jgi:hypothetical protein
MEYQSSSRLRGFWKTIFEKGWDHHAGLITALRPYCMRTQYDIAIGRKELRSSQLTSEAQSGYKFVVNRHISWELFHYWRIVGLFVHSPYAKEFGELYGKLRWRLTHDVLHVFV